MNKIVIMLFFLVSCFFQSSAQYITAAQYIQEHKDMAIREMKRMGVPAAITLAQGLLETENGNSELVKKSNNHFGIKCKSSWTAGSVSHDDDAPGECFRMYKDADDSYRDHSNFLRGNDRYAFLFKLDPTDYKGWAYGLRKAGYATNPKYPEILINNIETNNLQQYTLEAAGDVPVFDASKYKSDPEEKPSDASQNADSANLQPTKLNTTLDKLLEINDMAKDVLLEKDQFVFLEKKQKEGNRNFCIAEPGETLYDIAQKNGIILQNLCDYNNLSANDNIVTGTKIFLKPQPITGIIQTSEIQQSQTPNNPSQTANIKSTATNIHEVQPKEGLYSISKKYGVSIEQLKKWNNLQSDNLQIGQQLIISK